jgi:hypothetical protein
MPGTSEWRGAAGQVSGQREAVPTYLVQPSNDKGATVKYMIMMTGSQYDFDRLSGKAGDDALSGAEAADLYEFMTAWNQRLVESGEFVDARGLAAPVHARRIMLRAGVPVVTDGPYAETQEVLAGYTIVDCASFDRATEIAVQLSRAPGTPGENWYVDVRPILEGAGDLDA